MLLFLVCFGPTNQTITPPAGEGGRLTPPSLPPSPAGIVIVVFCVENTTNNNTSQGIKEHKEQYKALIDKGAAEAVPFAGLNFCVVSIHK